jgi:hypothetical protein
VLLKRRKPRDKTYIIMSHFYFPFNITWMMGLCMILFHPIKYYKPIKCCLQLHKILHAPSTNAFFEKKKKKKRKRNAGSRSSSSFFFFEPFNIPSIMGFCKILFHPIKYYKPIKCYLQLNKVLHAPSMNVFFEKIKIK